ncbi:response regulator [Candidatus Clostridium stratigraminis]|uniref:Stage 0 sporulation protein A homolog n=1 Tax=Candidatus Clostridium stratigraminis TaxID=3381661 RepID=A0ABW8TAI5_9CLOT
MKILIAEDDYASRRYINKLLSKYGHCDLTLDGMETLDAFMIALDEEKPYDLICLDIMMPKVDGTHALKAIREIEKQRGIEDEKRVKVIMTTALNDIDVVKKSFDFGCEAYAAKPINEEKLIEVMLKLDLIK